MTQSLFFGSFRSRSLILLFTFDPWVFIEGYYFPATFGLAWGARSFDLWVFEVAVKGVIGSVFGVATWFGDFGLATPLIFAGSGYCYFLIYFFFSFSSNSVPKILKTS